MACASSIQMPPRSRATARISRIGKAGPCRFGLRAAALLAGARRGAGARVAVPALVVEDGRRAAGPDERVLGRGRAVVRVATWSG